MTIFHSAVRAALCVAILACAGCASIIDGSTQTLSVKTADSASDVVDASCTLSSNKGTWFVKTPGTVAVHRSYDDLNIKCDKDGYQPSVVAVPSVTKGMAFGNILFGGLIGAGVDMGTGAAYDYPELITVQMAKLGESPAKQDIKPAHTMADYKQGAPIGAVGPGPKPSEPSAQPNIQDIKPVIPTARADDS